MPELPEVETVRQTLQPKIAGLRFTDVQILLPKIIRSPEPEEFKEMLINKKILRVARRGKYLLLSLTGGMNLVSHLRMTGSLVYSRPEEPRSKYTHLVFGLDNGGELRFADMRQFGGLWLVPADAMDSLSGYKDLGVEPLGASFTTSYLKKELRHRHARIKPLLLDQTFIAGLGNIYTDEALHRARIHPERLASTLNPREVTRLHHAIQAVLKEGIAHRGTTVRDFIDGDGRSGSYQELLRVYNREGQTCGHCGKKIVRKKIGGRSSYYCPSCQKA
ncbi:MAG: Formamidopyrimidine-DNA glycosylase [Pelotomaculum sp. PtaB.Bin104]|nr:MAG: Formamidopyrimidine-DNA glycosylase [Pelotomaculum sp. PtaB.Bin104]